ncbi:winged helix-turn-helix domain-containing protein [Pseudomonas trivialis]|uniref:Histidine kinase n=1 Tax=Pseudomonas trivialis TaxID=200450 RepID=A0A0H5AYG0_9PSED|nr:winged helix-turn-helix domain-containing protein [Pseudomonas trivialis]AKS09597.1 histidine kinase [Pseudomonas trivialis]
MSSLKKYAFTPTLPAIALQDFTPNAELFQYDVNALSTAEIADKTHGVGHRHSSPTKQPRLNTYVITHTITLPSHSFTVVQQESRMPMPKDQDSTPIKHTRPPEISPERTQLYPQDFWLLTQHDRTLVKGGLRISLTTIESALIKKMLHHEERVVSKEELIRNIGREPELYRGLEMCLSRLQDKFKRANDGERLFRAVRNRGYCLTQKIKKPLELTQSRR